MRKASRRKKQENTDAAEVIARDGGGSKGMLPFLQVISSKTIFHLLAIAFVGLIAYSNTFNVPFVFDDNGQIAENLMIRRVDNFLLAFKGHPFNLADGYLYSPNRFIGYLTLALNYRFGGLSVTGYHFINLAIHILNGILVYLLVTLTFKAEGIAHSAKSIAQNKTFPQTERVGSSSEKKDSGQAGMTKLKSLPDALSPMPYAQLIALFSALLFVAHPIQTQAVTYIVQRFASLATMFYLLSVVFYIKGRLVSVKAAISHQPSAISHNPPSSPLSLRGDRGGLRFTVSAGWYLLSMISAVLAMKTKEIAFTLPIVIIVYEFIFFRSSLRKKLLFLIPVILTLMIIPISILGVNKPLGEILTDLSEKTRLQTDVTRWDYMFTEIRVITTYIRLIFLPINQNLDYDYPIYHSFFTPPVFFSFLFLSSLFATAVYLLYKTHRAKSIGHSAISDQQSAISNSRLIAFGILWFFIALSVESSIVPIADVIFEHRVYLPSLGFFIAFTTTAFVFGKTKNRLTYIVLSFIVITLVFTGITHKRNRVWNNELILWEDVVAKSPNKSRPLNNLGLAYIKARRYEDAEAALVSALNSDPSYVEAYNNLGDLNMKLGKLDAAEEALIKALSIYPDYPEAHSNLAAVYIKQGRYDEALKTAQKAVRLNSQSAEAYNNVSVAYRKLGRYDYAFKAAEQALRIRPDYAVPYNNIGLANVELKRYDDAMAAFKKALSLDPDYAEGYNNLGGLLILQGRYDEAIGAFRNALKIDPGPNSHVNLGIAYSLKHDREAAMREYMILRESSPKEAEHLLSFLNRGMNKK